MAAGLVDAVVGRLGGMVVDQITMEASLFFNFRKDFEWLNKKLKIIRSYLKNADVHSAHNESVKGWLLDVADIVWDAEDILEDCAVESVHSNYGNTQSACAVCPLNYSQLIKRYKMGRRIKDIRERMRSVMEDATEFKLVADLTHSEQPSTSTSQIKQKKRPSVLERDARPVAIEPKVEEILNLIDDPAAPVIAVVGMGGVGKTFLLQNVFNRIKHRFEYSIWLSISQTYSLQRLQADLAANIHFNEFSSTISEEQAAGFIHSRLQSTRSLIVLDDVWRATEEYDLIATLGLPRGNNTQCKIVVSTRSRDVVRNMNARLYNLKCLSAEESWELFCAFAFSDCEQNTPPNHLVQIASAIEKECGGLPLAIKIVAASLADKTSSRDWESKLRELKEVADRDDDPILEILKLSYNSLPPFLKPCFAYFSFFPEDEQIDPQYLIYLWIAEGFIKRGEDQLEIGWSYINQLANLCLVEIEEPEYLDTIESCKMHDLLLDLAIDISNKEGECVFSVDEAFNKVQGSRCRRILLAKKSINGDVIASSRGLYSASRLRTLSLSQNAYIDNVPAKLFTGMRALRVLDLSSTAISALPTGTGNLNLVRVLSLSNCTQIKEIPECVRSMKSLRFLDISWCGVVELPEWIGELNCLEYLDISNCGYHIISRIPEVISMLVSLRVLRTQGVFSSLRIWRAWDEGNEKWLKLEHFVKLINLREVSITARGFENDKRRDPCSLGQHALSRNNQGP